LVEREDYDICVVGGAGHVGLPLALAFAAKGQRVLIYDLNAGVMERIKRGEMPFVEYGAEPLLAQALRDNLLMFSSTRRTSAARRTSSLPSGHQLTSI
jgi:UDP-N-acetyl-D-mannosaminuronic acid dehydrogenase